MKYLVIANELLRQFLKMEMEKSISCDCEGVDNAPLILKAQSDDCLKLVTPLR